MGLNNAAENILKCITFKFRFDSGVATFGRVNVRLFMSAEQLSKDSYALERAGEAWLALEGARLLNDRAAALLDAAWEQNDALSGQQWSETVIGIVTSKVVSVRGRMEITNACSI